MLCPKCHDDNTKQISYEPPKGYDPILKKYHCKHCDTDFYVAKQAHFKVDGLGNKIPLG
jgi:transcriptional regulator NrdR family protein